MADQLNLRSASAEFELSLGPDCGGQFEFSLAHLGLDPSAVLGHFELSVSSDRPV